MNREQKIIRTSIIGILTNILLAAFKAGVGLLAHSISVVLDAVNNLSDALSSVITIVGTKIAGKKPDRKHPFGHGRAEYLSAMLISVIVLYAGVTAFMESVKKIIDPVAPDYSTASLIIIFVAIIVKIVLGSYFRKVGKETASDSLSNSGADAILDSVISATTLAAALIYMFWHVSLEAWLGAVIAVVIIRSGYEMLSETISRILGERSDSDLAKQIKAEACAVEGVQGAYDLILHDYGPDNVMGSVHVEVPDYYTADQLDRMTRQIQDRVFDKYHVILTAIGFYAQNTKNDESALIREHVRSIVMDRKWILQMHGFHVDPVNKVMRFDVVVDFMADDRMAVYRGVCEEVQQAYPDYSINIVMDSDISD
ncbi:MAG: cation diffusion facilitator family transporter [Solobacterium sp.]|nr:cation diffusion facilitator family transporter [Solobacterium sp.]